jgi:REP element-mobilizing transposase RayT
MFSPWVNVHTPVKNRKIIYGNQMTQRHAIQNDQPMMITTVTKNRNPIFGNASYAREAIECLYRTQQRHPFLLYAFVIMPDHIHLVLQAIAPESISRIMNVYKGTTSASIGIGPVWQPRFHIRYLDNAFSAIDYVHANPMRKNIVECPEDYPWSSACGRWDVSPVIQS